MRSSFRLQGYFALMILMLPYSVSGQTAYWADEGTRKIQRAHADQLHIQVVIPENVTAPYGMAIDFVNEKLYWTTLTVTHKIQRSNMDGTMVEDVITTGINSAQDIAIDSDSEKLYWADAVGSGGMQRANLDGSERETIVPVRAISIALDPTASKLYWCESGGQLRRANLDGSDIEDLFAVSSNTTIAIDHVGQKIYWTEPGPGRIRRANLDGSDIETLFMGLLTPWTLELDVEGGWMYWVDRCRECWMQVPSVNRATLDGTGHEALLVTELFEPAAIALHRPSGRMFVSTSPNGLHFGRGILSANVDGAGTEDLVTSGLGALRRIAIDSVRAKMYWTDVSNDKIQRSNLDGTEVEDVVTSGLSFPTGLALDLQARRMYWSDNENPLIRRASLDGTDVEVLVSDENYIFSARGMALDLVRGKMYWANVDGDLHGEIVRADLDGSDIEVVIVDAGINPLGVSIDADAGKIYWTRGLGDGFAPIEGHILRADLDGTNIEHLVGGAPDGMYTPLEVALDPLAGKMYWTDGGTGKIQRANMDGTQVEDLVMGLGRPRGIALDLGPRIIESDPASCAVDARIPHDIDDSANAYGWSSVILDLNVNAASVAADAMTISEVGGDGVGPGVLGLEVIDEARLRVDFDQPIQPGAWTCLHLGDAGSKVCLGYLPADVDGDRVASPVDILKLIDDLNGVESYGEQATDIDRSMVTDSADILRLIDLLNGAGAFRVWNGQSLPDCP